MLLRSHMTTRWRWILTGAVLMLGTASCRPDPTGATPDRSDQLSVAILDRASDCQSCALRARLLGTIGALSDSILFDFRAGILLTDDNRFVVAPTSEEGVVAVFDSFGASARRVGRRGDGPGENTEIVAVSPWRGDTTILLQWSRAGFLALSSEASRVSRLDGGYSELQAVTTIPAASRIIASNANRRQPRFVVFDPMGQVVREIAKRDPTTGRVDSYRLDELVARAPDEGHFWSATVWYDPQYELWGLDGQHVSTIKPSRDWFESYDSTLIHGLAQSNANALAPAHLRSIHVGTDGTLWGSFVLPKQGAVLVPPPSKDSKEAEYRRNDLDAVWEIIDTKSGKLMLTVRLNFPLQGLINDTLAYERRQSEEGVWQFDVYRIEFERDTTLTP